jgi:hypothetical protein
MMRDRLIRDQSLKLYHRMLSEADNEVQRVVISLLINTLSDRASKC